jgi:hypothetical protein
LYNAENVAAVLDGAHVRTQHGKDSSTTREDIGRTRRTEVDSGGEVCCAPGQPRHAEPDGIGQ